jgi:DNA-directed RNA polymerase beta subunit
MDLSYEILKEYVVTNTQEPEFTGLSNFDFIFREFDDDHLKERLDDLSLEMIQQKFSNKELTQHPETVKNMKKLFQSFDELPSVPLGIYTKVPLTLLMFHLINTIKKLYKSLFHQFQHSDVDHLRFGRKLQYMEDLLKLIFTINWNENEKNLTQEKSEALSRILMLDESGGISINNWEMNVLHVLLSIKTDLQSPQTILDYQNYFQQLHGGECYGCQEPYFHNL